jgi:hypothetical protein
MDGATDGNFLDLAKFACQRWPVGMLVSNPFRDIERDSRLIFSLASRQLQHSSGAKQGVGLQQHCQW